MLYVGIEVTDVSFAAGSLARIVLCFGSWRQQRLRGFQQESAIGFRNGDVLESKGTSRWFMLPADNRYVYREEDATSFELVATTRIDVAAGSSRGFDDVMLYVGIEVADISFAAGSLARIVLCFGSWQQQRLRGFKQDSAIGF
ncbi:hypothetical protein F511_34044 [Dorcoceras hygrometricum]|uniref:Uncharacterized protein n=1 Tax=Dorcoceras hygrometricum TaxID=472368 RepID=A0A2Z7BNY0_9LAMI|nr:hypothetical protein F511_34044 [Dorcoceras hygrometricum]